MYSRAHADWDRMKFIEGVLYPLQRRSRCILLAHTDWDTMKFIGGVLSLFRDAVGVFYCLSCLGYHEIYWGSLNRLQRTQSVYHTAPANWDTMKFIGGVVTVCRDAVGELYCPSWLGYHEIHWGSLNPLERHSRWIILPQLSGIPWNSLGES